MLLGSCSNPVNPYANVKTGMHEFTAAYLAKAPHFKFGMKPYGEAGMGALIFSPAESTVTYSNNPNQPIPVITQRRFTGLYAIGVETPVLIDHLGARFEYRSLWYTAPSFNDTNGGPGDSTRPMFTQEPVVSVYYKF